MLAPNCWAVEQQPQSMTARLAVAADFNRRGNLIKAEETYRKILNDVQLTQGFGSRDVVAVLNGLIPVLGKLKKTQERDAAVRLANDIKGGLVPLSSNAEAYMRKDKTVAVMRRIYVDAERYGYAHVVLHPGEEAYTGTLAMVGGLTPGVGKLMAISPSDSSPDQAMGLLDASKKDIGLNVNMKYNYTYRLAGERKNLVIEQKSKEMAGTIMFTTALLADYKGAVSGKPPFIAAYKKDAERMPIQDRVALAFFLQPKTGIENIYPWIMLAVFTQLQNIPCEELDLLRKSFPSLMKIQSEELAKQKTNPAKPAAKPDSAPEAKPQATPPEAKPATTPPEANSDATPEKNPESPPAASESSPAK
jgi:hypothetical protein